jgi:FtsP/CotA-like multicopper oxidase with cupredoxin domain
VEEGGQDARVHALARQQHTLLVQVAGAHGQVYGLQPVALVVLAALPWAANDSVAVPLADDVLPQTDGSSHLLDVGPLHDVGLQHVFVHPHGVDLPYAVDPQHGELLKSCDGMALVLMVDDGECLPCELYSHLMQASSLTVAHLPTLAFSWGLRMQVSRHHARALLLPLVLQEQKLEEVRHPRCHQG